MTLEIVAQSVDDALVAERAGADRLELVSALSLGGLTPSIGTLEAMISRCKLPVMAMLRPRTGGFGYSPGEVAAMEGDADRFLQAGAQGLVFGVLDSAGEIDMIANRRLVQKGGEAVFHRAFDRMSDPFETLERLIDLGFRRVLTSGGQPSALDGIGLIQRLIERASGRIEILVGGGVRPSNVAQIVEATGTTQVHLAGQEWVDDPTGGVMAFNGPAHPEARYGRVDGRVVAATRAALSLAN